mmetsp:Transcript_5128/g.5869  ORF Transcript_5128/g.5869 Transcript_5128/m.5869 type:complete len:114 (-) Transcript_5128:73-414(-)
MVVACIKAFMDICSTPVVLTNYLIMLLSWIYFRDFVYCYEILWKGCFTSRYTAGENDRTQQTFILLLIGLFVLNAYWTILFFRMGLRFIMKSEIKDMQNPIEDIKTTAKIVSS